MQDLNVYKCAMGILGTLWANNKIEWRERFSIKNIYSASDPGNLHSCRLEVSLEGYLVPPPVRGGGRGVEWGFCPGTLVPGWMVTVTI
jgi:hypothetical protein